MSNTRHITITQAKILIVYSVLRLTSPQPPQGSIHLSLIHRDSTLAPSHNPQTSPYDRVKHSFVRSKARFSYLVNMADQDADFQGKIAEEDGEYFVRFTIGTPPVQMFASMDIASELILTRMNKQAVLSLSCSNITCNSSKCTLLPETSCDNSSNACCFSYGYADFSRTNNLLRRDVFNFETSNGKDFSLEDVIFGSKYDIGSSNTSSYKNTGVLGLGFHNLSLIKQLGSIMEPKFTYCLGNSSDPEAEKRLVLGNAIRLEGKTTTLKVINGRYNLVLKGLSIGNKTLQILPDVFQLAGGVIIDAGTTLSFIAAEAYERLVEELEEELDLELVLWPDPPYQQCYKGKLSDLPKFQGLVFHFEREVSVVLDVPNLFLQVEDNMFCLAMLPSPVGVSVLGSLFQQSYSVGYHLGEMLVSFEQTKCEVLENHVP